MPPCECPPGDLRSREMVQLTVGRSPVAVLRRGKSYRRSSSRANHALAILQSRMTVCGEMSSTSAVSSTDSPPKKRSSMTCARLASIRNRVFNASSS